LPVLDDLERALEPNDSNELRARLTAMSGNPKLFDLRVAAAVGSEHAAGAVVFATRRGFLLDDELPRRAQVVVAKPK